jgi:hypothetical protein
MERSNPTIRIQLRIAEEMIDKTMPMGPMPDVAT